MTTAQHLPSGSIGRELQKNLLPGEQVLAFAQGKANQLLMATDTRVLIIKGAVGSGGAFFGTTATAFFYPQLSGVQVRKGFGDGYVEVSASGMQHVQTNRSGQINAPNIVPFNAWDEARFQEVVGIIRQRMQQIYSAQMGGMVATPMITFMPAQPQAQSIPPVTPLYVHGAPAMPSPHLAVPAFFYRYKMPEFIVMTSIFTLGAIFSMVFSTSDTTATSSSTTSLGTSVGTVFCLAAMIYACVRDWQGVISMRGLTAWGSMSGRARAWTGIGLFCIFPIVFIIYYCRTLSDLLKARKQDEVARPMKIAQMEAEMGIMPATEGKCRACNKPLHAGAEFCSYCSTPVVERPIVCPQCAATALPNARFCPRCRAALPTEPAHSFAESHE